MLDSVIRRTSWANQTMPRVLFVGSYPPRECGIATFTEDVSDAYDRLAARSSPIFAITDNERAYTYGPKVVGEINRDDWRSYDAAADVVNASNAEVVNLQHEYGLFGGDRGDFIIEFLSRLRMPVVTTLHTILPDPDAQLRAITREVCNRADIVVVMSRAGGALLESAYRIDARKIRVVPHGAPDAPQRSTYSYKRRFGLRGKIVIGTFGLIGRGKGIEYILDALPEVFDAMPDAIYMLCGQTHPNVRRHEGEAYREALRSRGEFLGISDRVHFVDHYLSDQEVVDRLQAMDVYVSPSLDPDQVVSGTLSYAVACGRPVVATSYAYARELLAQGRGLTVPFRNSDAIATATIGLLRNGRLRRAMARTAYRYGRRMLWPVVARGYELAFVDAVLGARRPALQAYGRLAAPSLSGATFLGGAGQ